MSERDKKEAADKAGRAARQAGHAANNVKDAAEAAASHLGDEAAEKAQHVKDATENLAKRAVYTEAGRGVVALGIGLITVAIGFKKLGEAKALRETVVRGVETVVEP